MLCCAFVCACSGPRPLPQVAEGPSLGAEPPPLAEQPVPLSPLTEQELAISVELREVMSALMALGERNVAHEWELAAATDYVAGTLEAASFAVTRRGFMVHGQLAQSLEVSLPGSDADAPVFVVGARFDSAPASPGADDNASGVAALLIVARRLGPEPRRRALRLVFFSDAGNRADPSASGAPAYLADLAREDVKVAGMLELSGLGYYSTAAQSQSYPEYIPPTKRSTADFVALASYAGLTPDPLAAFAEDLRARMTMPLVSMVLLPDEEAVRNSAHRFFAEKDVPSFLLFDTHHYRYADFGGPRDTQDRIDFERMARVVAGLTAALEELTTKASSKQIDKGPSTGAEAPAAASGDADAVPLQPAGEGTGE